MRFPGILLIASVLVLTPLSGFARSKSIAAQNNYAYDYCKASFRPKERLRIILKTGQKIDGKLHAQYPGRIEIHRKKAVLSILCSDIKAIEVRESFWQKIKSNTLWGLFVAASPFYLLWLYITDGISPDC
ncbi:MAG: hypothetical protein L0229_00450 [Blastocatellia bacterium]|nr:hypothetical protein [Blastocatellia bacterium]